MSIVITGATGLAQRVLELPPEVDFEAAMAASARWLGLTP